MKLITKQPRPLTLSTPSRQSPSTPQSSSASVARADDFAASTRARLMARHHARLETTAPALRTTEPAHPTGAKSLDAFLERRVKASPSVTQSLRELMSSGALSQHTARTLSREGTTVADVRAAAAQTQPHQDELGVIGEAMARVAVELLSAATDLNHLTAGPVADEVTAQALPTFLAEGLTCQQPPAVQHAMTEFLTSGFLTPSTFEGLGNEGLGRLSLSLLGGLGGLETLLGSDDAKKLGHAAAALGQAALSQVRSFDELTKVFLSQVPTSEKQFWKERTVEARAGDVKPGGGLPGEGALNQRPIDRSSTSAPGDVIASGQAGVSEKATAHARGETRGQLGGVATGHAKGQANAEAEVFAGAEGKVSVSQDGVNAAGRAGVGARGHADASGEASATTSVSHHRVAGHVEADAEVYAGVEGEAHVGADGARFNARAGASAEASASASGDMNHELFGGIVGADTHVEGSVRARAAAQVTAEGNVGFDKEGDVEAYIGGRAEAIAVVEAEGKASQSINIFGFKFVVGGYAKGSAGVGAEAHGGAGYRDGKFYVIGGAGAAAEAGGTLGGFTSIELPRWAQQVLNMVAKTEQGRSAIGSVGSVLGGLLSGGSAMRA